MAFKKPMIVNLKLPSLIYYFNWFNINLFNKMCESACLHFIFISFLKFLIFWLDSLVDIALFLPIASPGSKIFN